MTEIKQTLAIKMFQLKAEAPGANLTQVLADYFNQITAKLNIKDTELVFQALLGFCEENNTTPMWRETVVRHLNWPEVIARIRAAALEKIRATNNCIDYKQGIPYLTECRTYKIITIPISWQERFLGKTSASNELLDLQAQHEAQQKSSAAPRP